MLPTDLLFGLGAGALLVLLTVVTADGFGLDRRAGLIERRDPGMADALRQARSVLDYSRGGTFGDEAVRAVCTPSRHSWMEGERVRSADADPRVEVAEEQLPPLPATVVALASGEHVAIAPLGRAMPGVLEASPSRELSASSARRVQATTRPRAGSR